MLGRVALVRLGACLMMTSGTDALATEWQQPTFEEVVSSAHQVARVVVREALPMEYRYNETTYICGYLITSEVVEGLKNTQRAVAFLSESDELMGRIGAEYFAIVFRREEWGSQMLRETIGESLDGREKARLECMLGASDQFVKTMPEMAVPFDTAASRILGGDWLRDDGDTILSAAGFAHRGIEVTDSTYTVVKWDDVRQRVREALEACALPKE